MNCQDNSRLKVPLPEMCKTTDIGCVPMTSGKPDCPPERDQIPLAYDIDSQTLWIFSCDSRQWVAMSKFQLAELQEVSLDNIRNICELLKIPVYYNPGGGTVQGSMPLADFGKELLKCQDMTPKAAVLPSGLTSFTIEGLESLDPLYVKYVNLEVSGTGSETDPLVIKAQDPLVKWPKKTEEDVDNADQPMLAADLDGEMVRVPYPKKPCEYDKLTQSQVEGANEAFIIGCVDESNVKIPYPPQPKDYDPATQDQVDVSNNRWLVAVIDGKQVKIPFPKGVCEFTRKTGEEISAATTDIIACVGGEASQIPLSTLKDNISSGDKWICDLPPATPEELDSSEGFSIAICIGGVMRQMFIDCGSGSGGKFPSIPVVCGPPSGPPAEGTPPLRVDCEGYLWAWDENTNVWIKIGGSDAPDSDVAKYSSISGNINNKCADTLIRGYYLDKNDPIAGYKQTKMTVSDLANALDNCGLVTETEMGNYFRGGFEAEYFSFRPSRVRPDPQLQMAEYSSIYFALRDIQLNDGVATYALHSQRFLRGSATFTWNEQRVKVPPFPVEFGMGTVIKPDQRNGLVQIKNDFSRPARIQITPLVTIYSSSRRYPEPFVFTVICGSTLNPDLSDERFLCDWNRREIDGVVYEGCTSGSVGGNFAVANSSELWNSVVYSTYPPDSEISGGAIGGSSIVSTAANSKFYTVAAGGTLNVYLRCYCTWAAVKYFNYAEPNPNPITEIPNPVYGVVAQFAVTKYPI